MYADCGGLADALGNARGMEEKAGALTPSPAKPTGISEDH